MVDGSGAGGGGGGTTAGGGNRCVEPDVEVWSSPRPYHADLSFSQQQPFVLFVLQPVPAPEPPPFKANDQKTQPLVSWHIWQQSLWLLV